MSGGEEKGILLPKQTSRKNQTEKNRTKIGNHVWEVLVLTGEAQKQKEEQGCAVREGEKPPKISRQLGKVVASETKTGKKKMWPTGKSSGREVLEKSSVSWGPGITRGLVRQS